MQPGDVVAGRFRIAALAGSGGMGVVYHAHDEATSSWVALKLMHAGGGADDGRFVQEATILAELQHPAIVHYVAHGRTQSGDRYLAMEWLGGEDLAARLGRAGLSVAESVSLVGRVAGALGVVHARGIVHRDIKPSNIFLANADVREPRVLDFGIARLARGPSRARTGTGIAIGTPGYMSPEQARGEATVDARTDVFGLGCVLYECLTGRPPFVGEHVMAILAKVLFDEVPRVSRDCPDVPAPRDELVERMLCKSPEGRPENGAAVEAALLGLGVGDLASGKSTSRPASALTEGEQRLVSVVIAAAPASGDLALGATIEAGPEESAHARARDVCRIYEARLEKLADGSFVAVVVGYGAATDQAAHAARCALALGAALPDRDLALATGRAVLSGAMPVGEVIERAVRLVRLGGAAARSLRVDEVTAALVDARFDVEKHGGVSFLRGEREVLDGSRTLLGRPTPCVGRERELALLEATWAECVGESVARALLVTGPAGVGKSRLRHEILKRVDGRDEASERWLAQGDPMSAGAPFGMAAQLIRQAAGLHAGAPLEERRAKLLARIARHVPGADAARVTEFLGECIGAQFPDDARVELAAARRDSRLMGDQLRRAFEDWIAAECAAGPRLLVLEDIHWGDWPTLQMLDGALEHARESPLMVLAFSRPEVHDAFPRLWASRGVQELRVGELSRRASERFVRELLGPGVEAALVERLVTHSGGHALFLEELVRASLEGSAEAFPDTVLAMVQARLEKVPAPTRKVLRGASVFGQTFWRSGLLALLDVREAELDALLRDAVERELIAPVAASRFAGESELAFRHVLTREAAYAMLTDEDRRLGHRLAAQFLEGAGEPDAAVMAEHFERGGEDERAVREFLRAAEQALEGNDLEAALARADRGIACGATGESLGALRALEAEVHLWRGGAAQTAACAEEARGHLSPASRWWWIATKCAAGAARYRGDRAAVRRLGAELATMEVDAARTVEWAVTGYELITMLLQLGEQSAATELSGRIEEVVAAAGIEDPTIRAFEARRGGFVSTLIGDHAASLRQGIEASARFEAAGNRRRAVLEQVNIGERLGCLGQYARGADALGRAIRELDRLGLEESSAIGSAYLARILLGLGELGEAERAVRRAIDVFEANDTRYWLAHSRRYLAEIRLASGDLAGAEQELGQAHELFAEVPACRALVLALQARVSLLKLEPATALPISAQAMQLVGSLEAIEYGELDIRLIHAEALWAGERREEARIVLEEARVKLMRDAGRIPDPELRASFLERVRENARIVALAAEWGPPP